jgi:hypothetical protein
MRTRDVTRLAVPALLVAMITTLAVSMSVRVQPVAASNAQNGQLHIEKDCSEFFTKGLPYCTITSFSLPIQFQPGVVGNPGAGSSIIYDQPGANLVGMLDSNVVLYLGVGNWATGRCTLNPDGNNGLCTFSDGVGQLAGFSARVSVTFTPSAKNPYLYVLDGTYSFNALPPR